jgi:hypothetical protein
MDDTSSWILATRMPMLNDLGESVIRSGRGAAPQQVTDRARQRAQPEPAPRFEPAAG